jgi:hypothetical protein
MPGNEPDVVIYECRDDPARKPTAEETILVVEVATPGTVRDDLHAIHRSVLDLEQPVRLTLPISELVTA